MKKALVLVGLALTLPLALGAWQAGDADEAKPPLRVGMEAAYAPFNWTQLDDAHSAARIDGGGYAGGYDVQMARRVAEKMGRDLVVVKTGWDGLIPAVQAGKIDLIVAGMTPTAERQEAIDFSDPYYTSDIVVVVKKDSKWAKAQAIDQLSGAKITGQISTVHYDKFVDQIPGVDKQTALPDFPTMILAVKSGKVDGYVSERPGALSAVASNPDLTFVSFPEGKGFDVEEGDTAIAIGLKKGSSLLGEVNQALAQIPEDERQALMEQAVKDQPEESADASDGDGAASKRGFLGWVGQIIGDYWPWLLKGVGVTMFLALTGTLVGVALGLGVGVVRTIPTDRHSAGPLKRLALKLVSGLLAIYIEVFRGTPMMVQAMVVFYGLGMAFNINLNVLAAGLLVVSINTGAYMAEIVRGGIQAIDPGQMEAGRALGMSHWSIMRGVVLPQAIRNILPATGNEFVINIKDTSVLMVIGTTELYFQGKSIDGILYQTFPVYLLVAAVYLVLTFSTTRLLRLLERHLDGPANFTLATSSTGPEQILRPGGESIARTR
ncbi:MAG: ABC transporter substrate-binding protein/permease [Bifidobacteriaceae bacterium]|jgi:putative lysine transport system permease protein|nr:ABC transporter substrate-binding protein/permease [Bifidobacteriaceae bacterium]